MVRTLTIGAQRPGGRAAYDGEAEIWKGSPHVAGIGEDAFPDLTGTGWFAVTDDAYLALQYLAIGFGTGGATPPGRVSRRALTWLAAARAAPPATPPGESGPMCLLTLDELNDITGLAFIARSGGETNCTYDSDTTIDPYSLDLSLQTRDPTQTAGDDLMSARLSPGQDVTVAGFPGWENPYVLTVDVGDRLLVVQPTFFFSGSPPPPSDVMAPIAEIAMERLPTELMTVPPTPTPIVDATLEARFPIIGGVPLQVQTVTGDDLIEQIEVDPGTQERFRSLEEALAPVGLSLEDLSLGTADRAIPDGFLTVAVIRVAGADSSLMTGPVLDWLMAAGAADVSRADLEIAGVPVIEFVTPGADESDIGARTRFAVATGDVLWLLSATRCEQPNPEPPPPCSRLAVARDIVEEIVAQIG
jgi:hypothetical protein